MDEKEQILSKKEVYTGKYISLKVLTVEKPSQGYAQREIVEHTGTVALIFLDEEKNVYLQKVYRKGSNQTKYEIFTSKLPLNEKIENHIDILKAERFPNIKINNITKINQYYPSPKYSDEVVYIYLCKCNFTESEMYNFNKFTLAEVKNLIKNNEIIDSPSIIGLLEILLDN